MLVDTEWEFNNTEDKPFWYRQESDLLILSANPDALKKVGLSPEEMPDRPVIRHDRLGVYEESGIPDMEQILKETSTYQIADEWTWTKIYGEAGQYGVADNVDQILAAARKPVNEDIYITGFKFLNIDDPQRLFVVSYITIDRNENPGWRWHKNGRYIGTQEPTCEHIGDEEIIQSVISYQIHELVFNDPNLLRSAM